MFEFALGFLGCLLAEALLVWMGMRTGLMRRMETDKALLDLVQRVDSIQGEMAGLLMAEARREGRGMPGPQIPPGMEVHDFVEGLQR